MADIGTEVHIGEGDMPGSCIGVVNRLVQRAAQGSNAQHPASSCDNLAGLVRRPGVEYHSCISSFF